MQVVLLIDMAYYQGAKRLCQVEMLQTVSMFFIHVGKLPTCLEKKLLAYFIYLNFNKIILAVLKIN